MINPQRTILNPDSPSLASRWGVAVLRPRFLSRAGCLLLLRIACLLSLIVAGPLSTRAQTPIPILLSEPTSTRAVALESVTFTPEPFAVVSPNSWNADQRTRVMLFAMNLTLQPGETLSSITADAEGAGQRHHNLLVEYLGPVPDQPWLSAVVLRLSDDLGDVGDVRVRISHNGVASNRVRIAIGHRGGGPADDAGAGPTPAPPYAITGMVREAGAGLSGVTVNLSKNPGASQTETFGTNTDGAYQFSVSVAGGNYTLTPAKTFYEFTPASRTFSNLSNHQTNIDFVATRRKYSIAGFVRNDAGQGLEGIQVTLTSAAGTNLGTTVSANGGSYAFDNLPAGFGYTVTPASNNVFTFASQSTSTLTSNLTLNFNGQRRKYTINGRITDGANGLAGVSVLLNGVQAWITIDSNGNYSFANLPAGQAYTVTPANNNVFTFTSQSTSALTSNLTFNFSGQRRSYAISGRLLDGANGLAGVSVSLNGTQAVSTTDSGGNYSFANLPAGQVYIVTPANNNIFTFTPQRTNSLTSNLTFNFSGQRRTYTINGRIMEGANGLGGVSVALNGTQVVTTTDSSGNYAFANLPAGFGYTVAPATNSVFTFTSQSTSSLTSNLTFNFSGQRRTYTISGRITDGANGLGGVSVALNGTQAVTTTDSSGNYAFANLPAGFGYTVAPATNSVFTFTSQSTSSLTGNLTLNFSGQRRTYTISGRITDDANGLGGVSVALNGTQAVTTTDSSGNYAFANLPAGFGYTVAPATNSVFTFTSQSTSSLTGNLTLNFSGQRRTYTISGRITDGVNGLGGVSVALNGTQVVTTTDSSGNYAFANLPAGFGYTVAPATNSVFTFTSQSTSSLTSNLTFNFSGQRGTYTISGRITDGANGLGGVSVALNDTQAVTTTDSSGNYAFANLPAGFGYTVAPATNSVFTFTSQSTSSLTGNLTLNFSGQRGTYTISGRITDGVNGLGGVSVALNGTQVVTTTDSSGNYAFANLPAGFGYTVAPATNSVFTFTSQSTSSLTGNLTLDFSGQRGTYTISGRITDGANGLGGVSVALNDTQAVTTTDSSGNYAFANLPAGFGYTVAPATNSVFTFTSQSTSSLTGNLTLDFSGQRRAYTISGSITDGVNGLGGVSVALNDTQAVTTTDSSGNYAFMNVSAGSDYVVTPSTTHYVFTPASQTFNNLGNNQTPNFQGNLRTYAVSGKVIADPDHGLAGITVTISGSQTGSVQTDAEGRYSFSATALGSYVLTPSVEQDWFTYSPSNQAVDNLAGDQTVNFIATAEPIPDPGYVLEFDGSATTVDYGYYWDPGVDLGHFFWEFWAMPGPNAAATYLLTDGYGGAHALLFGVANWNTSEPNRYQLIGNIYNGITHENYFRSDQGPAPGEWGHFAVGWDGQNIITYFNGVPVGKSLFTGPRFSPGIGGGGSWLMIGGSNHSNFEGRIAQVRGYEAINPREDPTGVDKTLVEASFAPQTVFSRGGNLLSYYFRPSLKLADLSTGYSGKSHPGIRRSMLNGYFSECAGCPLPEFVIDPTAPNFATGAAPAPVNIASAPVTPNGVRIFDSFSRTNSTYLFNSPGGLGSTEGGSDGAQVWQTNQDSSSPQPFGILNGKAVLLANDTYMTWVATGSVSGNIDARVERHPGNAGSGLDTGLSFRVLDDQNFFFAYTSADAAASNPRRLTVGYYLSGQRVDLTSGISLPASWTILQVVTKNSGELKVYADGVLLYTTTDSNLANATGAGLYNNSRGLGLVNRWDNFTVYDAP